MDIVLKSWLVKREGDESYPNGCERRYKLPHVLTVLGSNSPGFIPPGSTQYDSGVSPRAPETVSSIDNFDPSRKARL
jgi:hypothetical protein